MEPQYVRTTSHRKVNIMLWVTLPLIGIGMVICVFGFFYSLFEEKLDKVFKRCVCNRKVSLAESDEETATNIEPIKPPIKPPTMEAPYSSFLSEYTYDSDCVNDFSP
jgi:hypothetical protein